MNKLFLFALFFVLAATSATPIEEDQCKVQNKALKVLAGHLKEKVDPTECFWCVAELAGVFATCAAGVIDWALIVACVAGAVGAGHDCYPCICWVGAQLGMWDEDYACEDALQRITM